MSQNKLSVEYFELWNNGKEIKNLFVKFKIA